MKFPKIILSFLFISVLAIGGFSAFAQNDNSNEVDKAAVAKLEKEISLYPDSLPLHDAYVKATKFTKWGMKEDPAFVEHYKKWMQKYPKSAVLPYALGHAYAGKESPKASPYLLQAIKLDPNFDPAYFDLWIDAERWGDFDKSRAYIKKASEIKPDNPDYAFYYANTYENSDRDKYIMLNLDVAKKFPESERGAQALYWLAARNNDPQMKIKYYEQLKKDYSPAKYNWSSSGMSSYYDLLLKTDPDKAATLAKEMLQSTNEEREKKSWEKNVEIAANMGAAQQLLSENKNSEALNILDSLKLSRWSSAKNMVLLLRAKALSGSGNNNEAYQILKAAYAKSPEKTFIDPLNQYGNKLGKSDQQIADDVWDVRDTASKQATAFNLKKYLSPGTLSLDDLKGKVVLLTYWFPGCGPCRGEFPHFQNVVNKFKGQDLVYVGINIAADQNDYVVPFMKSSGYTFIPIEDVEGRNKGNLDNRNAAPVNFLIDKTGKIVYSDIRTDGSNEDLLATMITSLLNKK